MTNFFSRVMGRRLMLMRTCYTLTNTWFYSLDLVMARFTLHDIFAQTLWGVTEGVCTWLRVASSYEYVLDYLCAKVTDTAATPGSSSES